MRPPYSWQAQVWERLAGRLRQGELMQAILFTGLPGVGKSALARELARAGLCAGGGEGACGECESCRRAGAGTHADLLEVTVLEDKKEILIDQIRDFCRAIQLTAGRSRGRFGIIHGADRLTLAAANALLKTLEEPPPGVTLLLTADQLIRVPATIRSRCARVAVPLPDADQAGAWLREHGLDPGLWRRHRGPCELIDDPDGAGRCAAAERGWAQVLERLPREGDSIAAAQAVGEEHFDAFLSWWQTRLLDDMKQGRAAMTMRRLWDALLTVRAQSHLNFNRLLALEGLFILYVQLASHGRGNA